VDEGGDVGEPPQGDRGCASTANDRHGPAQGHPGSGDGQRLPHRRADVVFSGRWNSDGADAQARDSQGLAAGRDDSSVRARRGSTSTPGPRSYFPNIDDPDIECMLIRGARRWAALRWRTAPLDAGLTGLDWVAEHEALDRRALAGVVALADLVYAKQEFSGKSAGFSPSRKTPATRRRRISRARPNRDRARAAPTEAYLHAGCAVNVQVRVLVGGHGSQARRTWPTPSSK